MFSKVLQLKQREHPFPKGSAPPENATLLGMIPRGSVVRELVTRNRLTLEQQLCNEEIGTAAFSLTIGGAMKRSKSSSKSQHSVSSGLTFFLLDLKPWQPWVQPLASIARVIAPSDTRSEILLCQLKGYTAFLSLKLQRLEPK